MEGYEAAPVSKVNAMLKGAGSCQRPLVLYYEICASISPIVDLGEEDDKLFKKAVEEVVQYDRARHHGFNKD
jgi:hypothetical protein